MPSVAGASARNQTPPPPEQRHPSLSKTPGKKSATSTSASDLSTRAAVRKPPGGGSSTTGAPGQPSGAEGNPAGSSSTPAALASAARTSAVRTPPRSGVPAASGRGALAAPVPVTWSRSLTWSVQSDAAAVVPSRLSAVPATAPPRPAVPRSQVTPPNSRASASRGSSAAADSDRRSSGRFVAKVADSEGATVSGRRTHMLGAGAATTEREPSSTASSATSRGDGPAFSHAPWRVTVDTRRTSPADRQTLPADRRTAPADFTQDYRRRTQSSAPSVSQLDSLANFQLRPLTNHQVLMEISSRWLAADAKAKVEAKAKAESKEKATAELGTSLSRASTSGTDNATRETKRRLSGRGRSLSATSEAVNSIPADKLEPPEQKTTVTTGSEAAPRGKILAEPDSQSRVDGQGVRAFTKKLDRVSHVVEAPPEPDVYAQNAVITTVKQERNGSEESRNRTVTLVIGGHRGKPDSEKGANVKRKPEILNTRVGAKLTTIEVYEHSAGIYSDLRTEPVSVGRSPSDSATNSCESQRGLPENTSAHETDCKPGYASTVSVSASPTEAAQEQEPKVLDQGSAPACDATSITNDGSEDKNDNTKNKSTSEKGGRNEHAGDTEPQSNIGGEENVSQNARLSDTSEIPVRTRRRRKQQLQVRHTSYIQSPKKAAVDQAPPMTSPAGIEAHPRYQNSNAKSASEQSKKSRRAARNDASSPSCNDRQNRPATRSRGGKSKRGKRGALRVMLPKVAISGDSVGSSAATAGIAAASSAKYRSIDAQLTASTSSRGSTTQPRDLRAIRPRVASTGSRSIGQLWSAWGGAVDTSPKNPQSRHLPPLLPKGDVEPLMSSQVTHARLQTETGDRNTKKSSKRVPPRQSWRRANRSRGKGKESEVTSEPAEVWPELDETDPSKMEMIIEFDDGMSPTQAAEDLWQALGELDADGDSGRPTSPSALQNPEDDWYVSANSDELDLEDLELITPLLSPTPHPKSSPPLSPPVQNPVPSLLSHSPANLLLEAALSTRTSTASSQLPTMPEIVDPDQLICHQPRTSPKKTRNLKSEMSVVSSEGHGQKLKQTLTPVSNRDSDGCPAQEPSTADTPTSLSPTPSTPYLKLKPVLLKPPVPRPKAPPSFSYMCLFCEWRFERAEQHLNHLVQCTAPITGIPRARTVASHRVIEGLW